MIFKFYDTCSLLLKADNLWDKDSTLVISSIVLEEIEHIKTSANKDPDVKFAARKIMHELENHPNEYKYFMWKGSYEINSNIDMGLSNDAKIIISAEIFAKAYPTDTVILVTNDLCCKHLAQMFSTIKVESFIEETYDYDGYKEVYLNVDEMNTFYSNMQNNLYDLHINEYLIIYDSSTNEIIDRLCWTGNGYRKLNYNNFNSRLFGEVKPKKGDIYQALAADSFINNTITLIKGPAGSGKTFLSLGFLLHQLERGRIDKIIVFCNTIATKNSAKLGYYPGTRDEKLLDSQIGNLLISKLGGRIIVE